MQYRHTHSVHVYDENVLHIVVYITIQVKSNI